jgi:soluble lytic murein transglycosylase-like protein
MVTPSRSARVVRALLFAGCLTGFFHASVMPARAAEPPKGPRATSLCEASILAAEHHYGTPPGLLMTIAKVESGRADEAGHLTPWPWTIDVDGAGAMFPTKEAAVAATEAAIKGGAQFVDIGCMQVDLAMHPDAFRTLAQGFDPAINADYGARFLRALHDGPAGGNWYVAVGLYHSATPELAAEYRAAVASVGLGLHPVWRGSGGGLARGRVWYALSGGGAVRLNVYRQPARIYRKPSACRIAAVLGPFLRSRPRC